MRLFLTQWGIFTENKKSRTSNSAKGYFFLSVLIYHSSICNIRDLHPHIFFITEEFFSFFFLFFLHCVFLGLFVVVNIYIIDRRQYCRVLLGKSDHCSCGCAGPDAAEIRLTWVCLLQTRFLQKCV